METWSIEISKDYLKFSAAHFLIFADGRAERLHGHNYRVFVEIRSGLDPHGLVLNFKEVKPLVRGIVDELDEHLLIPGKHPVLTCEQRPDGLSEILYHERRYLIPSDEVIVLPIGNTSAENLAGWIGARLMGLLAEKFPEVEPRELVIGVEETPGQRGVCRIAT